MKRLLLILITLCSLTIHAQTPENYPANYATQCLLFVNAFRWVVSRDKEGDPFLK